MKYSYSQSSPQSFGPLPAGDYQFTVTECGEPDLKESGNWVLAVRLAVGPEGATVFDNPWARSEKSATQDGRDGIAQFLESINMAPARGKDPNWKACVGKKGKLKLKIEKANQGKLAGQDVNKVSFYFAPTKAGASGMEGQSMDASEFQKARKAQEKTMQGGEPEAQDLPY